MSILGIIILFFLSDKPMPSAPATAPTTQQALVEMDRQVAEIAKTLSESRETLKVAERECLRRLTDTDDYKFLLTQLEKRERVREEVQLSGTPQQKLDAGAAWAEINEKLKKERTDALQADEMVTAARADVHAEEVEWNKFEAGRRAIVNRIDTERQASSDVEKKALAEKKVEKGMTLERVIQLWGKPDEATRAEDGTTFCARSEYDWVIPRLNPGDYHGEQVSPLEIGAPPRDNKEWRKVGTLSAWFFGGKVVKFEDVKLHE